MAKQPFWGGRRLLVAAYEHFFPKAPDRRHPEERKIWEKCVKLGWRVIWLAGPHDIVLLYAPPPEDFMQHVQKVMGYRPIILWPDVLKGETLDLVGSCIADRRLMDTLVRHFGGTGIPIQPLLMGPKILPLQKALQNRGCRKITLAGYKDDKLITSGRIASFNDKAEFQGWVNTNCPEAGMPGRVVLEPAPELVHREILTILGGGKPAVVQQAVSAGGLGNQVIVTQEEANTFLARHLRPDTSPWRCGRVLVAPKQRALRHISATALISDTGVGEILYACRAVTNLESTGTCFPYIHRETELLRPHAELYFRHLFDEGYRGWVDVDAIVYRDASKAKRIALCESNARLLLTNVAISLRDHFARGLRGSTAQVFVEYTEKMPSFPGADLSVHIDAGVPNGSSRLIGHAVVMPPDDNGVAAHLVAGVEHRVRNHMGGTRDRLRAGPREPK